MSKYKSSPKGSSKKSPFKTQELHKQSSRDLEHLNLNEPLHSADSVNAQMISRNQSSTIESHRTSPTILNVRVVNSGFDGQRDVGRLNNSSKFSEQHNGESAVVIESGATDVR